MDQNMERYFAELFDAIEKYQNGEARTGDKIREMTQQQIYNRIYDQVQDQAPMEKLMQQTYVRIFQEMNTLQNVKGFYPWAYGIADDIAFRYCQEKGTASQQVMERRANKPLEGWKLVLGIVLALLLLVARFYRIFT